MSTLSRIAVCVPHWNRTDELVRMYNEYMRLYADLNFEFSVADDGSTMVPPDPPRGRVHALPYKTVALNPCVPLNIAVARSVGEILVLTGPELEHRQPILKALLAGLGPNDYAIAACRDMWDGRWLCGSQVRGGEAGRGPMPPGSGFHFCTALHRELFERAGGFDDDYRAGQAFEDNDWLFRLQRAGARFVMHDELVVWHRSVPCSWPVGGHERNRLLLLEKWGPECLTT